MANDHNWITPCLKQIWTSLGVLIIITGQGIMIGYPSYLLHALKAPDSPIKIDIDSASWIAASSGISFMVGCFAASIFMDWYGRRKAFILAIIPSVLGWLIIYLAYDVPTLLAGRLFDGLTAGSAALLGVIVIGEYTSPKLRGVILILKTTFFYFGSLLVHLMGYYLHWRTAAMVAMIAQLVALGIVYTWRESPAWLASKKRYEECEREFYWLRGNSQEAMREFEELVQAHKERLSMTVEKVSCCERTWNVIKKFSRKDFLMPLLIMTFGGILVEASGRHIFPAYARQIVGDISSNETQAFYNNLFFDLIICISTTVASILIKHMNRRTLLFGSGIPALILLFSLCSYMSLASKGIVPNISWVPIVGFLVVFILSNLGCIIVPYVLLGEIFPFAHKGVGLVAVGVIWSSCAMVGVKLTPYLLASIKVHGTFAVFGSTMGISLLVLYFIQPETNNRTLQQIEDIVSDNGFRRGRRNRRYEAEVFNISKQ